MKAKQIIIDYDEYLDMLDKVTTLNDIMKCIKYDSGLNPVPMMSAMRVACINAKKLQQVLKADGVVFVEGEG